MQTSTLKAVRITYKQKDTVVLEKKETDATMQDKTVKVKLSQEDTLMFAATIPVQMQIKVMTSDGTVLASPVRTVPVDVILNEEVLE